MVRFPISRERTLFGKGHCASHLGPRSRASRGRGHFECSCRTRFIVKTLVVCALMVRLLCPSTTMLDCPECRQLETLLEQAATHNYEMAQRVLLLDDSDSEKARRRWHFPEPRIIKTKSSSSSLSTRPRHAK